MTSPESKAAPSCWTCRFGRFGFMEYEPGACPRRAPVVVPTGERQYAHYGVHPLVSREHWCGEHEPRAASTDPS